MIKLNLTADVVGAIRMIDGLVNRDRWIKVLRSILATVGLGDIRKHMEDEAGPDGKWPPLNDRYEKWKRRKGKTKMLVLSGDLSKAFLKSNMRSGMNHVTLFNPISYAGKHDRGKGVPQRKFMWLSDRATDIIHKSFVDRIMA